MMYGLGWIVLGEKTGFVTQICVADGMVLVASLCKALWSFTFASDAAVTSFHYKPPALRGTFLTTTLLLKKTSNYHIFGSPTSTYI